jgi:cytochrome c oxidase assembly protein subunit 15
VRRLRLTPDRYVWLCRLALAGLVVIVVTGGAVRLTGSGLGCTDWPTCEHDRLVAPLEFHPMVEFVNRVITGLVSVLVILAVGGALARVPRRRDLVWLAMGLVGGVVGQVLLGAALVLADLDPRFTIGHFLLSAALVGDAVVLLHRAGRGDLDRPLAARVSPTTGPRPRAPEPGRSGVVGRRAVWPLLGLGGLVIVTGTVVTGTGPHGGDVRANRLGFDITDVARVHSLSVWAFAALLIVTALRVARRHGTGAAVEAPSFVALRRLLLLVVVQGGLGYAQYLAGVPPLLVGFHLLGATLVWAATVEAALRLREAPGGRVRVHPGSAERPAVGAAGNGNGPAAARISNRGGPVDALDRGGVTGMVEAAGVDGGRETRAVVDGRDGFEPPSSGPAAGTLAGGKHGTVPVVSVREDRAVGTEVD